MKIAYLDTIAGIAGDMTMAAFVAAGVPLDRLADELRKLPLGGFELQGGHVRRNAIDAVHLDVVVTQAQHHHRHLPDILSIIERGNFSPSVTDTAGKIFRVIAGAEAAVHGTRLDAVHFHEVGAVDSIVDIVGVAICLDILGIEAIYSSPVRLGSGALVDTSHGRMPVPAPATLEILRGYPTVLTTLPYELTTPTGAAIVKALSAGILDEEVLTPQSIGYGAGTLELPDVPNLLRVVVGEIGSGEGREEILVVETQIDDMNPQIYPFLLEQLLADGAADAYLTPVIMKKGRPGMLVTVLTARAGLDPVVRLLLTHTSTIGVRISPATRRTLPRRSVSVSTSFGAVRAKVVVRDGREVLTAEFEECRRIAEERSLPLRDVLHALDRELSSR